MPDSFDLTTLNIHGYDVDNNSMPLTVGGDTTHSMPLFLQRKNGIPEVTNWDDSINSVSKTDKSYFIDQQGSSCGEPQDIAILDDICVVGYPKHTPTYKTEIDISSTAHQTYVKVPTGDICYGGAPAGDQYDLVFGLMFDYALDTPEIDEALVDTEDENYHTYFYDTYLRFETGGESIYYPFGGFISEDEYAMIYGAERQQCNQNNTWLNGPSAKWYYIKDTGKIALSVQAFTFDEDDLEAFAFNHPIYYSVYSDSQFALDNGKNCIDCPEDTNPERVCQICSGTTDYYSIANDVQAALIKLTRMTEAGKVDIYHKKSGYIESYTDNQITSTDHDLSDGDIIKISGEFGTGNLVSDLNGILYADRIDNDTFGVYSDPNLNDENAVRITDIDDFTGMKWTCVGNADQNEFQSWKYYTSIGSNAGVNGYNVSLPNSDYGGNYDLTDIGSPEVWDDVIPAYSIDNSHPFNFKASKDYAGGAFFGYSLDIMKVKTDDEEFYILAVGEPGNNHTWTRLGEDEQREEVLPCVSPSGRVNYYRLDKDSNGQLTDSPRATGDLVGEASYIRADDQPWRIVEQAIGEENCSLLVNPSNIVSTIDIADAAVDEDYWLEISPNPNQSGTGRQFVWNDRFGRGVGNGHQHDLTISGSSDDFYSTSISSYYRNQIYNIPLNTAGASHFAIPSRVLSQEFHTENVPMMSGIQYNYDKLVFAKRDGIVVAEYANPVNVTDDQFTQIDKIAVPDDATTFFHHLFARSFGQYVSHYGEYVLTNSVSSINEFGNETANNCDYVFVYKRQNNDKHKLLQKISPCIAKDDDFYTDLTEDDLDDMGLVANGNLSYSGKSEKTYTWTGFDITGNYDIWKNKIIYRDPLEYVVFKDNWNTKKSKALSGSVSPENYFFYRERFNSEGQTYGIPCLVPPCPTYTDYVSYSYDSNFDGSISVVESYYRHDTLILFFDIPRFQGYVNVYDSLNVRLSIDRNAAQDDAPMLKFYSVDPRDTISNTLQFPISDGACDNGTAYDLGTYNGGNFVLEDDGTYSVDVDIPASVFMDGLIEGDITDTADRNQDSYNNTGTVHKTLAMGIKIRRRGVGGVDCYIEDGVRLDAGNFYESNAQIQDATLRLSYSLYEEKSLRRFDVGSRKIALPNIEQEDDVDVVLEAMSQNSGGSQIRMSESISSAFIDRSESESVKGMSSNSLQVFESSSSHFRTDISVDLSDYKLQYNNVLSSRLYDDSVTTSSLDLHDPEFLTLFIRSNLTEDQGMILYEQGHNPESGSIPLVTSGIAHDNGSMPLVIGPRTDNNFLDLALPNTYGVDNNSMPLVGPHLKGFDAPPTGINLYTKGPDAEGSLTLFEQAPIPATGNVPLVAVGPLPDTGNLDLFLDGHRTFNTSVGRPPLYMAGMQPDSGNMDLHIGRDPASGDTPLVTKGPIQDTGNMPLYMLSPFNDNLDLSMPETKGQQTQDMTLVMFDDRQVNDLDLSVSGPIQDTSETTLFTKYDPVGVNNIDDNPHNPCKVDGPNYRFDISSNSEQVVVDHNSVANENENIGIGFDELEDNTGPTLLGQSVRDIASDSDTAAQFYSQDRLNTVYDSNGSIFVVGQNTFVFNSDSNAGGLLVYDVSNGVLSNRRIFDLISSIDSDIYKPTAKITYKDLAVSDSGRVAFSIYVKYTSSSTGSLRGKEYLVILDTDFTVDTVVESQFASPVKDFQTVNKRIADSVVWDGEDLYYSEQTGIFDRVVRRTGDYSTKEIVAEFEDTADFANYEANLTYNESLKTGFGHKIVITDNKLVVAAPLVDPYLAQNAISSYVPYSPRGAVYLFNRSGDTFTYSEAVYATGLTDSTITPTSFAATTTDYDTSYFGYSIDYSDVSKKLIVGEPGYGNTTGNGGYGRVYTFDLRDTVSLLRTTDPNTIATNTLFGLFVALCDGYTELALSREANGKVYNINTGEVFEFDSDLTDDEVDQYVPDSQTLTSSSEETKVMKLVNLGSDKLVVGRKFDYTYGFTVESLYKLTALNAGKPANFTLFMKTVEAATGEIPLIVTANEPGYLNLTLPKLGDNNNLNLTIQVPEPDSGNMPLTMANTATVEMTTYIKGLLEEATGNQDLFLKVITPNTGSMPLNYVHPYDPKYRLNLSIRAADPKQQWTSASLFIDEGTITRTPTDLTKSTTIHTIGDSGVKFLQDGMSINIEGGTTGYVNARPTLFMQGQPSVDVDEYIPLYIEVDDPSGDSNNEMNLFLENTETSGTKTIFKDNMPLYIINSVPSNENATLFLQRKGLGGGEEFKNEMNLHTKGPDQDSDLNLYSTATYSGNKGMNLVIPETLGEPTGVRTLMIRGYEE